jgi:large subunit ribosomal protein L14
MIQTYSILRISDNSGGKKFKTIKVLLGFKKRYAFFGESIVGSVQGLRHHKKRKIKVKDGEVIRGLIIRTNSKVFRSNYSYSKFRENAVVLLNKKNQPLATRVMGPVFRDLRKSKYMKVASLSVGFV